MRKLSLLGSLLTFCLMGGSAYAQQVGIGGESLRFYTPYPTCDYFSCTNYVSSNHFMGDIGGGIRYYVWHNVFVRSEARLYLVHNNVEFSSGHAGRYGISIGYSFGR